MALTKKISTQLQLLDKFLDTSGDAGSSGQVLSSTGTGINWISGGNLPGGPYIPLTGNSTLTGNLTITGDLTVEGSNTILETQTVEVEDNILQLNTTQGSPDTATATTSGISVYRGDGVTQASLIFDDADDTWDLTNNLKVASQINAGTKIGLPDGGDLFWDGGYSANKPVLAANGTTMKMYPSGASGGVQFSLTPTTATFAGDVDITRNTTGQILSRIWNSNTGGNGTAVMRIANSGNQANGARLEFSDNNYYNATVSVDRTNGMRFMVHDNSTSMSDLLTHTALTLATNKNATFAGLVSSVGISSTIGSDTAGYFQTNTAIPANQIVHIRDNVATTSVSSAGGIKISAAPGNDVFLLKRWDHSGSASYFSLRNNANTEHLAINMASGNATFAGDVKIDGSFKWATTNATSYTYSNADASGLYIETVGSTAALSDMRFQARAAGTGNYSYVKIKPSNQSIILGTNGSDKITINSTGTVAAGQSSTGNAFAVNRGSDGATVFRIQNSGEVVTQNNYFYAAGSGVSMYVQNSAVFRGSILNDTSNAPVTIGDDLQVNGNITLNGDGRLLKFTPTSYDDVELGIDSNGFVIYNTTDARYDLKINGDGNATFAGDVGIGTTPETAGPTWRTLFVGSSLAFISRQSASGYDSILANNYYINSSNVDKKRVTGTSSRIFLDGDVFRFQNAGTGNADTTVTWNERMRIDAIGNVGIGDTSPSSISANTFNLSINSSRNDLTGALISKANGTIKHQQYWDSSGYGFYLSANAGDFKWRVNNNDRMVIDKDGGLDLQGTEGQLFSVTNSLTGDLFSVSDISGIPILNVNSNGDVDIDGKFSVATATGQGKLVLTTTGNGHGSINTTNSKDLNIAADSGTVYINDNTVAASNVTLTDGVLTVNDGNNYVKISEGTNSIGQIELKDSNPVFVQGWGSDFRIAVGGTYNNHALIINASKNATFTGGVTVEGGTLDLGKADTASGHINAKELMTFNIDTDNDDTNRYFAWYKDSSSGSGTELLKILETGAATFAGTVAASGLTTTGVTNNFTTGTSWGTNLTLTNTNDDGSPPILTFLKSPDSGHTTMADNDYVGFINFRADNSNNDIFSWVELSALAIDVTDGSEDSAFRIGTWGGGTEYANTIMAKSGKVGIGTASPGAQLHNYSTASTNVFITGHGTAAQNDWGAQNAMFVKTDNGLLISKADSNNNTNRIFNFYNDSNGNAQFYMHASLASASVKIQASGTSYFNGGNVGIGTTSPRGKGLEIHRAAGNSSHPQLIISTGESSSKDYGITTDLAGAGDFAIVDGVTNVAANARLLIKSDGKVGIANTDPATSLHVGSASANHSMRIQGAATAGLQIFTGTNKIAYLEQHFSNEGVLGLTLSGTTTVRIRANADSYFNSGNIGIGTTAPNQDGFGSSTKVLSIKANSSGGESVLELIGLGNSDNDQVGVVNFMSQAATAPLAAIKGLRHTDDVSGKLAFFTKDTERMRINESGTLHVKSTHSHGNLYLDYQHGDVTNSGTLTAWVSEPGITYHSAGIGANIHKSGPYYGRAINGGYGTYIKFHKDTGNITMANTTGTSGTSGGQGSTKFTFAQNGTLTAVGDVIAYSDIKLKENVKTLEGNKVLQMRGVSFDRKDTGKKGSGVIAQEVQKIAPELVHKNDDGTLGVAYGNLTGYLIEAVKQQQETINKLVDRIEKLENK